MGVAVEAGNEALVRVLLAAGADPKQANQEGVAPLDMAQGAMRAVLEAAGPESVSSVPKMKR